MPPLTDLSEAIARFVSELDFDAIPGDVFEVAKRACVDGLAVAAAAATAPGVRDVKEVVEGWGGRPEASLIGSAKGRLPAPSAALLNGLQIHARDFDDTHDRAVVHPTACVFPAVLAGAERRGGVSGRKFLTAFVAGGEVACRLGMAYAENLAFERTTVCGVFGAAAGAAKILSLPAEGIRHALGIAFSYAGGTRQGLADGALTKRLQPGLAARGGLEAALLAGAGVIGPRRAFSGPSGFFAAFGGEREAPERLMEDAGARFDFADVGFKPYPCCRYVHPAIDAAIGLREEISLGTGEIDEIIISVPPGASLDYVSRPFPAEGATTVDRQFSLPFVVATALGRGRVRLEDFEERTPAPEVARILGRTRVVRTERQDPEVFYLPAAVTVRGGFGERTRRCERLKGSPAWPMTEEEHRAKVRHCLEAGASSWDPDALWELVTSLEEIQDVREMTRGWESVRIG